MTSSTTRKGLRSDKWFAKTLKEVDAKFWNTIEYEKKIYGINKRTTNEEK